MGIVPNESLEPTPDATRDFDLNPGVVLCAGNNRHPLVLSRETPQNMIETLARRAVLDIWGGPVLTLLSLGFLMKYLGAW